MNLSAVLLLVAGFLALHQDFWLWGDATLVMGFLPAGLAYHVVYSLCTAGLWAAVCRWGWPSDLGRPGSRASEDGKGQ